MDYLYSPLREAYLKQQESRECIFCLISQEVQKDEEHYVFYRDEICYGVMNLYPYTPGHLMFIPHAHLDSPHLLSAQEWQHLALQTQKAVKMLYDFGAQGVNSGLNIREAGGAGIPHHLHWHLVPRFQRDTNFMTSIAQSRIYGCDFKDIFTRIKALAKIHL